MSVWKFTECELADLLGLDYVTMESYWVWTTGNWMWNVSVRRFTESGLPDLQGVDYVGMEIYWVEAEWTTRLLVWTM